MARCLTQAELERHARGEMDRAELEEVERHLASCPRCQGAYESLLADDRVISALREAYMPRSTEETEIAPRHQPGEAEFPQSPPPWPPDSEVSPPTAPRERFPQIEGYQIKRIIGRGGMGVVYEALQEKLNRPVALKMLPAVVSTAHPEFIARFKREAAAAARLHHTNIIPIYDFGESRDGYYYAMELISGQPFSTVIKRLAATDIRLASSGSIFALLTETGPPQTAERGGDETPAPPSTPGSSSTGTQGRIYYRQVAKWMADAAEALHYAHLQGMVHRDIKPSNLMLCTDGRIMILDFGLVKTAGERSVTVTGSLVGTYRYMSPEQIGAKRIVVDARSDVYSLGATLYELLTFQPAFPSLDQSELLSQILFKEPTPPRKVISSVPVDLQTICQKAMEKSPSARYQSAKAMADDLNAYLNDLAIVARRQGPIRRLWKLVRRRRLEVAAVAALMLLIGAVATGWHYREQERRARENERAAREQERKAVVDRLMSEGADAHWKNNEPQLADRKFREALTLDPDRYGALYCLAIVNIDRYYEARNEALLVEARELLDHAIRVRPDDPAAYNGLGVLHQASSRPLEAITAYEKAREIKPGYFAVWVNLAMLYATQGDLERAESYAQEGIKLLGDEKKSVPWRLLAAIQVCLGRREAENTLKTALSISKEDHKEHVATLVLCALYNLASDDKRNAEEALYRAVSADSLLQSPTSGDSKAERPTQNFVRTKRALAIAAVRNEKWERAKLAAEEALAAGDQPSYADFALAIASARLGDLAAAREHFEAGERSWPEALKHQAFVATEDGRSVWFDTADDLRRLHDQAQQTIASQPMRQ